MLKIGVVFDLVDAGWYCGRFEGGFQVSLKIIRNTN